MPRGWASAPPTRKWPQRRTRLPLRAALTALPLPVGLILIGLYALHHLWREHGRAAWLAAGVVALALIAGLAFEPLWQRWLTGDGAISAALILFFVAILAGVPVGFVLLLASAVYLWATGAP